MKKKSLPVKILIALVLGIIFSSVLQVMPASFVKDTLIMDGILKLMGTGFMNAIKMIVVPLVFVSLVVGVSSISDTKKLGVIGTKIMAFYLITTGVAVVIAMFLGMALNPAVGLDLTGITEVEPTIAESKPFVDVLLSMIPTNPVQALASAEMLQIIFFALLIGIAMTLVGEKAKPVQNFFESSNEVTLKAVELIMKFAPYGVFALISRQFATLGWDAIFAIFKYILVVYLALVAQVVIVYLGILKVFTKIKVKTFLKKAFPPFALAFSSSSSSATLPVTLEAADELGISREVSSFTLPLGATVNMDGTAIMQGVSVVFIATITNINLGPNEMLMVLLTATLASIGTAGVPGAGMIMLAMVLQSVGIPPESIALVFGVDRILDMGRTSINVLGDLVCTTAVCSTEGMIDNEKACAM